MPALRSLADTPIVEQAVSVAERAHDLRGHCPGVGVMRTPRPGGRAWRRPKSPDCWPPDTETLLQLVNCTFSAH
jgi:hypothetical protein